MTSRGRFEFWIDRGGTFTDCIARDPATGQLRVAKLLSSDRAPLDAIRELLGLSKRAPIPPCDVRMGTTLATNALLERKGVPFALAITRGFRDLLAIGTQARPKLFDLRITKPELLYREVLEVDARADAHGEILERPDPARLRADLLRLRASGLDSLAVAVLHAYRGGELERAIGDLAHEVGFGHVALSHEVAPEIGLLARGDTVCVDAYLTPLLRAYVAELRKELPGSTLRIMQSSGGLAGAEQFRGPHSILSGPAGGVVACAQVAAELGAPRAVGFDMGGTSTDVSRVETGPDGRVEFERVYETETAGVRIFAPMLSVHTVAAGGGSLCRFDGHRFRVGPESAGAHPGPLCYGDPQARELTVTDVNLALGRLVGDRFPFPLQLERVLTELHRMAGRLREAGMPRAPEEIASGFLEIANANMAEAIRQVSVARGYDVREYALVVFGGAGGQHACALARRLGMRRVLVHPLAGVLSAYGMGLADVAWHGEADVGRAPLEPGLARALDKTWAELEARGRAALASDGFAPSEVTCLRRIDLRYAGTETSLTLPIEGPGELRARFEAAHERAFGYARPSHPIEATVARAEVLGRHAVVSRASAGPVSSASAPPRRRTRMFCEGAFREDVPVFEREALAPGTRLSGPALVLEATSTLVVDPGFELEIDGAGRIVLSDRALAVARGPEVTAVDPVKLEIMNNLFMSIAEQMGIVLRRTSLSTNIRERLDFSCAVFDREAGLVANAPHIPVHLGAMSESVRAVMAAHPNPAPGDVFVTNDPAGGGSHLPDVTVVTPVHDARGALRFFSASRGHHADVGGITPGSMPPFSHTLEEEGVVLRALRVVRQGRLDESLVLETLCAARFPARSPRENLADLEAAIAANRAGARLLLEMVEQHGDETVDAYMRHVQDNAAAKVADEIEKLPEGEHRFADTLDDGTPVCVRLVVRGRALEIDFTGTGAQVPGNLNAPRAVTVAAVIYVLRALVGEEIPLNAGCLRPVALRIPSHSLLDPDPERAVCGGNVETSQRVVDVLLGALDKLAACQGTMNNLTFGNERFGYYETIGGGAGAGPGFDGASGVHTHMTNTRITDPEVLESRFPVRVVEFSLRAGSGGAGRWRGGDGLVRELEFLEPMRVSILSERRERAPFGLEDGLPGARGRNTHQGRDVGGKASFDVAPGGRVRIETPGGGGFGAPP
ncbi:MAG TPA: hydantoinase B/oxoprolinase family protein [Myxococcota bacterium]|nr:hydantoinase B/oxoprolinase family protein [Myxococcota bacterium]